jgi:hypothetical protein
MRSRKVKDIEKVLLAKGFKLLKNKSDHYYYHLFYDGKKTNIFTFLSHGAKSDDYSSELMNRIKKQLHFIDSKLAENFLDCPMSEKDYLKMLLELKEL